MDRHAPRLATGRRKRGPRSPGSVLIVPAIMGLEEITAAGVLLKYQSNFLRLAEVDTINALQDEGSMAFVTILDEAPSGEKLASRRLEISASKVTLRKLIEQRIHEEVEEFNRKHSDVFSGLVQPIETERILNGYRLKTPRKLNWENQYAKALEAFEKNGFFVIVDGHQVEELDEVIPLRESSEVHFLKLVPLVGG